MRSIEFKKQSTQDIACTPSQRYLVAATSNNTRKAYQQDIRHFMAWGGVLPSTSTQVVLYLEHYATQLNSRTLIRRVTALKNWHTYQGFTDPTTHPMVHKTLKGIQNIHGTPKDKAPALQITDLQCMVDYLRTRARRVDWRNNALLQLGFFGAFRRSELAHIRYEDITFMPQGIIIRIPRSKTDQAGEGQTCAIPYGDQNLCPATALKAWCEEVKITQGYIFRRISKSGKISEDPIAPEHINIVLKKIAQSCHLSNALDYSSHSLRRGFATTASQQGASLHAIMRQGRWKHVETAMEYIEQEQQFENNAAGILLKS